MHLPEIVALFARLNGQTPEEATAELEAILIGVCFDFDEAGEPGRLSGTYERMDAEVPDVRGVSQSYVRKVVWKCGMSMASHLVGRQVQPRLVDLAKAEGIQVHELLLRMVAGYKAASGGETQQ